MKERKKMRCRYGMWTTVTPSTTKNVDYSSESNEGRCGPNVYYNELQSCKMMLQITGKDMKMPSFSYRQFMC